MAHSLSNSTGPSDASLRHNHPDFASDAIREAKEDLAACFRMAARLGFEEGICNHFSALLPGHDDLFIVNPYGYAFRELKASDLLVCDFHGKTAADDRSRTNRIQAQPRGTKSCVYWHWHRKRADRARRPCPAT